MSRVLQLICLFFLALSALLFLGSMENWGCFNVLASVLWVGMIGKHQGGLG